MSTQTKHDVIIIGAGISGLSCAIECQKKGLDSILLEASDKVGGRVKSEVIDNNIYDRGFQVFLSSYPKAGKLFKSLNIDWCHYPRSASIFSANPQWFGLPLFTMKRAKTGSLLQIKLKDMWQLSIDVIQGAINKTNLKYNDPVGKYIKRKYSNKFANEFLLPFFRGIFLCPNLDVPRSLFQYYLYLFAKGGAAIPRKGMGQLSIQLSNLLDPNSLYLNTAVESIQKIDNKWLVTSKDKSVFLTRVIIIATDHQNACQLIPFLKPISKQKPICTHYFLTDSVSKKLGPLTLFPKGKFCHHIAIPTLINQQYGNYSKELIMTTTYGLDNIDEKEIRSELQSLGIEGVDKWTHSKQLNLKWTLTKSDLPSTHDHSLILAGDWTTFSAIEGAVESGLDAANKAYAQLSKKQRCST